MSEQCCGVRMRITKRGQLKSTAEAQRGQREPLLDINELSKRILGTAIDVLIVRRRATVVFYLLKSQRTLRLCGEKQVFYLGILGILAHFRHFFLTADSCILSPVFFL